MGRRPLPDNVKRFRGKPGHRPLNGNEPEIEVIEELPEPPRPLCPEAQTEWNRVLPYLIKNRILGPEGLSSLCTYCNLHAAIVAHEQQGRLIGAPYITQYRLLAAEFALTPTSRARIKAGKSEKKDAQKERFFAG